MTNTTVLYNAPETPDSPGGTMVVRSTFRQYIEGFPPQDPDELAAWVDSITKQFPADATEKTTRFRTSSSGGIELVLEYIRPMTAWERTQYYSNETKQAELKRAHEMVLLADLKLKYPNT